MSTPLYRQFEKLLMGVLLLFIGMFVLILVGFGKVEETNIKKPEVKTSRLSKRQATSDGSLYIELDSSLFTCVYHNKSLNCNRK